MKKWTDMANLGLLDDAAAEFELPARAFDELAKHAPRAAPAIQPPQRQPAGRAPGPGSGAGAGPQQTSAQAARKAPRVFSSRPTLRQLMQDYNKRTARLAPIKCHSPVEGRDHFRFQRIDLIRIPNIPGKILRPAPATAPGEADTAATAAAPGAPAPGVYNDADA